MAQQEKTPKYLKLMYQIDMVIMKNIKSSYGKTIYELYNMISKYISIHVSNFILS